MHKLLNYKNAFRILKGGKISLVVSAFLTTATLVHAAPNGGNVTSGSATISQNGNVTNINQSTNKASINWQNFNVNPNETVNFNQPNSNSVTLNRVIGTTNSLIQGAMNANGQVILVNPNGVVFTEGSSVNVGGLVATTKNITDQDFQNDNYKFEGNSNASILNKGTIKAKYVAMMGKTVQNEGRIEATLGRVELAGGNKFTLNLNGDSLLKLTIDEGTLNALVENKGIIKADGGKVYLTTQAVDTILDGVVNNTGIIEAQTLNTNENGEIVLFAHGGTANINGTLDASAPNVGNGGFIETSGTNLNIADSALITTKSTNGQTGQWLLDPVNILIQSAITNKQSAGTITGSTIATALATTNVTLETGNSVSCSGVSCGSSFTTYPVFVQSGYSWSQVTDGWIVVNDDIIVNNNSSANTTLTLNAYGSILWLGNKKLDATSGTKGVNVVLNANVSNEAGTGSIDMGSVFQNTMSSAGADRYYYEGGNNISGGMGRGLAIIKTNGGDFTATAIGVKDYNKANSAIQLTYATIEAGSGNVTITGSFANPDTTLSKHGVALEGFDNGLYIQGNSIDITGTTNKTNDHYFGISLSGGRYIAGAGGITMTGMNTNTDATNLSYGLALRTFSGSTNAYLLSETGDITLTTSKILLDYDGVGVSSDHGIWFGKNNTYGVNSSSSNVTINTDYFAGVGNMTVDTTGNFTIQSIASSWATNPDLSFGSLLTINEVGSVVLGKAGNTSNMIVSLPTINGGITLNGTEATLNSSLISNTGNITLNTDLYSTLAIDIQTLLGNIYLNGNVTTTDTSTSAIFMNAGVNQDSTDSTGGNIILSGTPIFTIGEDGRVLLYSGDNDFSTGLSDLTTRPNINGGMDETTDISSFTSSGIYVFYRGFYRTYVSYSVQGETKTYGESFTLPTPTFTGTPTNGSEVRVYNGNVDVTAQAQNGTLPVGTYTVKVINFADENHIAITDAIFNGTLTIEKADVNYSVSGGTKTQGESFTLPIPSFTGGTPTGTTTVKVYDTNNNDVTEQAIAGTLSVGTYTVKTISLVDTNYNLANSGNTNGTLTILASNSESNGEGDLNPEVPVDPVDPNPEVPVKPPVVEPEPEVPMIPKPNNTVAEQEKIKTEQKLNNIISNIVNNAVKNNVSVNTVINTPVKTDVVNVFDKRVTSSIVNNTPSLDSTKSLGNKGLGLNEVIRSVKPDVNNVSKDTKLTVVGETGGEGKIAVVELADLVAKSGGGELRVALSPNSFVELVNGGVTLPTGVSQEFYVVEDKK